MELTNEELLIYREIGAIIKLVQYLESNLLAKMNISAYTHKTLGEIIALTRAHTTMDDTEIEKLQDILGKRNHLVHNYFKEKHFEHHHSDLGFLEQELSYLRNFKDEIRDFNKLLIELGRIDVPHEYHLTVH
jgi:hypothetical protein